MTRESARTGPRTFGDAFWLAVGADAAEALEVHSAGFLGDERPAITRVEDVHDALVLLDRARVLGCVVSASVLDARPRAALESLKTGVGPATVLVRETGPADPEVRRAAQRLGIHVWSAESEEAAAAPVADDAPETRVPAPEPEPAVRAPEAEAPRRTVRTGAAPLPRADDDPPPPEAVDPGRFAEGCLERIGRLGALVRYVLRTLSEASGASRISLMLREADRGTLRLQAGRGIRESLLGQVRCAVGTGIAGRVAALGRPVAGHGSQGGPREYHGSVFVVLPLGRGRTCEGVISLTGFPDDRMPDPAHLKRWKRLCYRAGTALRSARTLQRARSLSTSDPLTRLPNRRAFERALARELERARRNATALVVGILDIDHFKAFNDRYGHAVGDRVLREVARRLQAAFRETDLVTRWGGEEFAVLLPGLDPTLAVAAEGEAPAGDEPRGLLDRARNAVRGRAFALGEGLPGARVTVSGGYAVFREHGDRGDVLLRRADEALYRAKAAGRDRIEQA